MEYINEPLLPGQIGQLFIVIAFVSSLFAAYAYSRYAFKDPLFKRWARGAFWVHALAVVGIIGTLYYLIFTHSYAYQYVWQHSANSLPVYYLISCLWEGQEGSFLLWIFFQAVLGLIFLHREKEWEAPAMTVFALVQAFLTSMLLGVYIGDLKIGSTPFILIRELPEYVGMPFTQLPNYLELDEFKDGRGLNPLLQNYWMVIHPPTLFLGFASVLIPFAMAIAGLWYRKYTQWIKPGIPWIFFAVGVLGVGILMGGAWAYEALSFGGFWAWDPVENAVLVPWLTTVAAAHLMLIYQARKTNLKTTYGLVFLSFILILYSTFLTRSGVLGDSSVHSFVDLGLNGQLLLYLFFFIALSIGLFLARYRHLPKNKDEDQIWTREFMMFLGALVMTISSFQVTFSTSIPVLNKLGIFGEIAPPIDPISHYNQWQVPFAIVVTLLMGIGQYMRYKKDGFSRVLKAVVGSVLVSIVITWGVGYGFQMKDPIYLALLFTSTFTVIGNLDVWIRVYKGHWGISGSSVAHIGFGLVMLGALISNANQDVISQNETYIAEDFPANENLLVELGDTVSMGSYRVTWSGERKEGHHRIFEMEYFEQSETGIWETAFTLEPYIQLNEQMGNVAEPSTKHYLSRDIYTHITYAEPESVAAEREKNGGYGREATVTLAVGDTALYARNFVRLDSLSVIQGSDSDETTLGLKAHLSVIDVLGERREATPVFVVEGNQVVHRDDATTDAQFKFRLNKVIPEQQEIELLAYQNIGDEAPFIVIKAVIFPWINLLWLGSVLMALGTVMAIYRRVFKNSIGK